MKSNILSILFLIFLINNLGFSKEKKDNKKEKGPIISQTQKVSDCITISTVYIHEKKKEKELEEWITFVYNQCNTPEKLMKRILILEAKNINIKNKLILSVSDLITFGKNSKIIFRVSKEDPKKPSKLKWKLID